MSKVQNAKTKREEWRTNIIEIVKRCVIQEGYDAVTMRTIAKKAKITLPVLYRYFISKEDMIEVALSQIISNMRKSFFKDLDNNTISTYAWGKVCVYGINYIRFALENPELFKKVASVFVFSLDNRESSSHAKTEQCWELLEYLEKIIADCVRQGVFQGDSQIRAYILWTYVNGLADLLVNAYLYRIPKISEILIDAFVKFGYNFVAPEYRKTKDFQESSIWMHNEVQNILKEKFSSINTG